MLARLFIILIKLYQHTAPAHVRCCCKFVPTCSEYAILALQKYQFIRAVVKIIIRLIRCSPISRGGIDYP